MTQPKKPTQAEIGRWLGISLPKVSDCARRGMPTDSLEAAAAWRDANVRARAPNGGNGRRPERPGPAGTPLEPHSPEMALVLAAGAFVQKHGVDRFGPLLVHLVCSTSPEWMDEWEAIQRHPAPFESNTWDRLADEYFRLEPPPAPATNPPPRRQRRQSTKGT